MSVSALGLHSGEDKAVHAAHPPCYEVERVMYHPMQISVVDIGILMYNEDEIHPVGHDLTAPMGYGPWALLF